MCWAVHRENKSDLMFSVISILYYKCQKIKGLKERIRILTPLKCANDIRVEKIVLNKAQKHVSKRGEIVNKINKFKNLFKLN